MVSNDKVSNDERHSDHDWRPPEESDPHAFPQREDEQWSKKIKLHVIRHVPSNSHALKFKWNLAFYTDLHHLILIAQKGQLNIWIQILESTQALYKT
jgi:hypothetical protein